MKKLFTNLLLIILLFFMIGCIPDDEVKIIIDEELEVYIDEELEVIPTVAGIKDFVLVFTSEDESIFMVEDNIIKPINIGSANLIISLKDREEEVKIKVYVLESKNLELKFLNTNFNILKGEELALVLLGNNQEIEENITWTSSDEGVATINSNGVVLGKAKGITTIKATYLSKSIETIVTVKDSKDEGNDKITVTGIKVIEIDEVIMLKASSDIKPATFVFESTNTNIATITTSGILKGINAGVVTIKVSLVEDPSINLSFDITVITPRLDVTVSPNNNLVVGDKDRTIIVRDSKGQAIGKHLCEFRSLDETIVTVSADGKISAVGVGKASIEVKYNKGIGFVEVFVDEAPEINYRNLIVQTAINEYGYTEGYNNDTKYGTWYGMPNQPWCAMFVSWCANEIGISITVIPKYASVALGLEWFQNKGSDFYKSYEETQRGEYTPICGDIVFFKSNGASHTGIVVKVVGDIMYTIEGNTSDRVLLRFYYYKNYDKITGYGIPNYQASSTPIYDFDVTRATFGGGVSTE